MHLLLLLLLPVLAPLAASLSGTSAASLFAVPPDACPSVHAPFHTIHTSPCRPFPLRHLHLPSLNLSLPARLITPTQLAALSRDPTPSIALLFGPSSCTHTAAFWPVWADVQRAAGGGACMVVVDGDAAETRMHHNLMVQGFPSVVRVGGAEQKPDKYVGARDVHGIVDWIVGTLHAAPEKLRETPVGGREVVGESAAEMWCVVAANVVTVVWLAVTVWNCVGST